VIVLALAIVVVTGYGIGFSGLPFIGTVVDVADVPWPGPSPSAWPACCRGRR
jgi:hypothetical protein